MISFDNTTGITTRQRWSHYFTIMLGVLAIIVLFNLHGTYSSEVSIYQNNEEGIVAYYPRGWLIDEQQPERYIFRTRDMQAIGFKTTFQLSIRTVSDETAQRTVVDTLTMERAQTRTAYRLLSIEDYDGLTDASTAIATYQFVEVDPNPFLEGVPIVVRGVDVITISRDQAIIITMLSDFNEFDSNFVLFERFLRQLEL
ncbi:MAG: hypothetical protein AAF787_19590 [Chloroflexota bacterium]